jgi:NarL family two-component system response regulator LiaR
MTHPIRILIVDDHAVVREGLRAVLETQSDMEIVGEARDGEEAVAQALLHKPDVVIMDLVMPRLDGAEATRAILSHLPATHILVLSSFTEDDKVLKVLRSGALGFQLKESNTPELMQAIRAVSEGKTALDPSIQRKLMEQLNRGSASEPASPEDDLTERELEVLRLMAQGASNQQIARSLTLAEGTVRFHVSNILSKLHLHNRTQAVLYALQKGLASLD